ncbi:beta-glucosidase [Anaerobacterium chartisolvens]|uniref:Beta-glucosidase n=1 Tax=Anaerobacterium chartisolvens TaxID=1297424 RepID=A0A369BBA7_9FIRM|nr:glycoside hydrolase family 3 N-terminal domain-containing protein [Anaerobacterium chartisolvens]RCX17846.1 beta-glucosidase [Anaerobacterium chartisolvens]
MGKEIDNQNKIAEYRNPNAPLEERIQDLLQRMTLQEKVRQMDQYFGTDLVDRAHPEQHNCADRGADIVWERVEQTIGSLGVGCIHDLYGTPDINNELQKYAVERTRLGIPILFSEEALHGLGRPGCSIFPQQITLAATWNPDLVYRVGRSIAAETRCCGIHEVFSPVIDLARDARWGRLEETYGEDTYLSSRMAVAMVKGLQGEDISSSDSVIAEVKHFSAYGIAEGGLNCAPVRLGPHEHESCFMPVFEAAFKEAGAINAMNSYSSIDGIPCVSNSALLTGVLRNRWKMKGFVRADMCSIVRLYDTHGTAHSPEDAIRQAIEAGVDMQYYDFSHEFYQESIIKMVRDGVMKMETIDLAVSRILRVKFLLGLFENPYTDPASYEKAMRCEKHGQITLQAARDGICLLKNKGGLLPLKKDLGSIAVIGPNADEARLGDYTPVVEGFKPVTVLEGIRKVVGAHTNVEYVRGVGVLEEEILPFPSGWLRTPEGNDGLTGEYFDSRDFTGRPVMVRNDEKIQFSWVFTRPSELLTKNSYTVRWTGKLVPDKAFKGWIGTRSYDSMRLWIDDMLLIDGWGLYANSSRSIPVVLEQGREYSVRLEYLKDANGAQVFFGLCDKSDEIAQAVEAARNAQVAIMVLGDSDETSGENMDRSDLCLPGRQLELLKRVYETGTPVVLVLQNGRPLSLTWELENIPAILEAWFGGEKGGQAVAEVLFGDVNPAGRLPVSFPKSVGQLPVNYNRKPGGGIKYVEEDWAPLFPFGYGLSYTSFCYDSLVIDPPCISAKGKCTIKLEIENIGHMAGDEVVQLYIHQRCSSTVRPLKELKGFQRIGLKPGEKRTVSFTLGSKELKVLNSRFRWAVEPGIYDVMLGSNSADVRLAGTLEVV